jgi:hypothetical protein
MTKYTRRDPRASTAGASQENQESSAGDSAGLISTAWRFLSHMEFSIVSTLVSLFLMFLDWLWHR